MKKTMKNILKIIIIIIAIVSIILLVRFAWAKYMTRVEGSSSGEIAKFIFNVNTNTEENMIINLAQTRTGIYQEAEVHEDYIGPGTSGAFQIQIDATNSEVSMEYNIQINVDNANNTKFPKNLIFYSDEDMKNALYHENNIININGFIAANDTQKVRTIDIYWKWDFETGQTENDKRNNDSADSAWIGRSITLPITVLGQQVNVNPFENKYVVTFNVNGGELPGYGNSQMITKTIENSEQNQEAPIPVKEGYIFDGYYATRNMKYNMTDYPNQNTKRFYVGKTENNWAMSDEDIGTHIQAKINISGDSVTSEPTKVEFNDLELKKNSQYYIHGNSGNWIIDLNFDITEDMLRKREYQGQVFDYSQLRLLDIEGTNYCAEDVICSADYFTLANKKYYDSEGKLILSEHFTGNTTVYAKWIQIGEK